MNTRFVVQGTKATRTSKRTISSITQLCFDKNRFVYPYPLLHFSEFVFGHRTLLPHTYNLRTSSFTFTFSLRKSFGFPMITSCFCYNHHTGCLKATTLDSHAAITSQLRAGLGMKPNIYYIDTYTSRMLVVYDSEIFFMMSLYVLQPPFVVVLVLDTCPLRINSFGQVLMTSASTVSTR